MSASGKSSGIEPRPHQLYLWKPSTGRKLLRWVQRCRNTRNPSRTCTSSCCLPRATPCGPAMEPWWPALGGTVQTSDCLEI